jgi:hypothetical protein
MGNIQLMGKTVLEGLIGHEDKYAPLKIEDVARCSQLQLTKRLRRHLNRANFLTK